jgi:uncharacterized membrane protein YphA (DoxX/SURF4 family)
MNPLDVIARAGLGWVFVHSGSEVLRSPQVPATRAAPVLAQARALAPVELPDDLTLVRINAATQVAAGTALILGVAPRLSAAVLIGSLIPTTAGGHRFWEQDDPAQRAQQRIHFNKNLAVLGGLVHVAITRRRSR